MPGTDPEVSVVVPVYRNAATVAELARRVAAALEGRQWELLFVEDACPAGSRDALRPLVAADARVAVLALARNGGQNAAVLAGLACCRGEALVVMDADLQDPPEAIPALLAALSPGGPAVVFAGRRGAYEDPGRLLGGRLFKRVLRLLSGGVLPADAGLFLALTRDAARRITAAAPTDPYVLGLIAAARLRAVSLPVTRAPRADGPSSYTGRGRLRLAWRALAGLARARWGPPAPSAPERAVAARLGWVAECLPGERAPSGGYNSGDVVAGGEPG